MFISVDWIKDFVDLDGLNIEDIANKFTMSCAEVEDVVYKGKDIDGIITAKIESIENHPNSKKLHLLKVNTGNEILDVVCGAPNVRVGMITAFATIGAKIKDIVISKSNIAGFDSCGMCCSQKELGIGDDHSGIMEFPEDTRLGVNIKDILPIEDVLIEVDNKSLTNRPDMWGHYGIAREIAAITGRKLKPFNIDNADWSNLPSLNIKVESESCRRYSALSVENVSKNISPLKMQLRLFYCGMRAISLLADLTNYIMLELGQPMHSFDATHVQSILVRDIDDTINFKTLDGIERNLQKGTMVIDLNSEIGAIAGIMGGLSSEIESDTSSVFLESANFDAVKVRKTATALGLRSEASARYEKSLDPEMTSVALRRYIYLLKNIDNGIKVVSNLTDVYNKPYDKIHLNVEKSFIDKYLGVNIDKNEMINILKSLEFDVNDNNDIFEINVPSFRATKDISNKADIVEEIARVYGYDNIKPLPNTESVKFTRLDNGIVRDYDVKFALADKFAMHEIHSYIWEDDIINNNLNIKTNSYIKLVNSLQKDNDNIRSCMMPTIIRALQKNKNYGKNIKLFEIGHVITGVKDNLAIEEKYLCIGNMFEKAKLQEKLLETKDMILYLFNYIFSINIKIEEGKNSENYLFDKNYYNITFDDKIIGRLGVLHPLVQHNIDESKYSILTEINMSEVNNIMPENVYFEQVSKYPTTTLDFNFILNRNELYSKIENIANTINTDLTYKFELVDIYDNVKDDTKSYTIRYKVTSLNHTLSSNEIENFHKEVISTFENKNIYLKS